MIGPSTGRKTNKDQNNRERRAPGRRHRRTTQRIEATADDTSATRPIGLSVSRSSKRSPPRRPTDRRSAARRREPPWYSGGRPALLTPDRPPAGSKPLLAPGRRRVSCSALLGGAPPRTL